MMTEEELLVKAKSDMAAARKIQKWKDKLSGQGATGGDNVITGYINEEDKSNYSTYPCHNPIRNFKNAKILWSAFGYRPEKKIAEFYFNWLINESPWARVGIVPKLSSKYMFEEGFIFTKLDTVPANLLHNFLIATRMAAEWPVIISDWYRLVQEYGIDPTYAFFMMTAFMPRLDPTVSGDPDRTSFFKAGDVTLAVIDKYDWPLDVARAPEAYLRNFLAAKVVGLDKKKFSPSAVTTPINILWGSFLDVASPATYLNVLKGIYQASLGYEKEVNRYNSFTGLYEMRKTLVFTVDNMVKLLQAEEIRLGIKDDKSKSLRSR